MQVLRRNPFPQSPHPQHSEAMSMYLNIIHTRDRADRDEGGECEGL